MTRVFRTGLSVTEPSVTGPSVLGPTVLGPTVLGPPRPAAARRLVAVVVTHNRLAHLQRCLTALLASPTAQLAAVVVVDNASTDGTAAWLAGQLTGQLTEQAVSDWPLPDQPQPATQVPPPSDLRLDVLRLGVNTGGAGGFATGMAQALARHNPDWLLLLDDDAYPDAQALAGFHTADLDGWDGVTTAVTHLDGRICEMNRPTLNPFAHARVFWATLMGGGRAAFHLDAAAYASTQPIAVDGASFVGFFVSRAAVDRVGLPDARLFLYGDDAIYTLRLSQSGGRIGFFPNLRFMHDSQTLGAGDGRFRPLWKAYYYHRNLLILYRMAAGWLFWPVLAVVLPVWLWRARAHPGARRTFLRLLGRAVRDGIARRTGLSHAQVLTLAKTP